MRRQPPHDPVPPHLHIRIGTAHCPPQPPGPLFPPPPPPPTSPARPLAAPAGTGCPARAADAQSPRARFRVFLPSASEDDPFFARTLPDRAVCSPRSPATTHGSPPTQRDARPPPCLVRIPPKLRLPMLSASLSDDSPVSPATGSWPAAPDPSCRDTHTLHQNR